jgi:hypothetical protein
LVIFSVELIASNFGRFFFIASKIGSKKTKLSLLDILNISVSSISEGLLLEFKLSILVEFKKFDIFVLLFKVILFEF